MANKDPLPKDLPGILDRQLWLRDKGIAVPLEMPNGDGIYKTKSPPVLDGDNQSKMILERRMRDSSLLASKVLAQSYTSAKSGALPQTSAFSSALSNINSMVSSGQQQETAPVAVSGSGDRAFREAAEAARNNQLKAAPQTQASPIAANMAAQKVNFSLAISAINTNHALNNLYTLHRTTFTTYMQKSLTLKYQQVFLAKELLGLTETLTNLIDTKLEAIKQNTGAPEVSKRSILDVVRESFVNKSASQFSEFAITQGKRITSPYIKGYVTDPVTKLFDRYADSDKFGANIARNIRDNVRGTERGDGPNIDADAVVAKIDELVEKAKTFNYKEVYTPEKMDMLKEALNQKFSAASKATKDRKDKLKDDISTSKIRDKFDDFMLNYDAPDSKYTEAKDTLNQKLSNIKESVLTATKLPAGINREHLVALMNAGYEYKDALKELVSSRFGNMNVDVSQLTLLLKSGQPYADAVRQLISRKFTNTKEQNYRINQGYTGNMSGTWVPSTGSETTKPIKPDIQRVIESGRSYAETLRNEALARIDGFMEDTPGKRMRSIADIQAVIPDVKNRVLDALDSVNDPMRDSLNTITETTRAFINKRTGTPDYRPYGWYEGISTAEPGDIPPQSNPINRARNTIGGMTLGASLGYDVLKDDVSNIRNRITDRVSHIPDTLKGLGNRNYDPFLDNILNRYQSGIETARDYKDIGLDAMNVYKQNTEDAFSKAKATTTETLQTVLADIRDKLKSTTQLGGEPKPVSFDTTPVVDAIGQLHETVKEGFAKLDTGTLDVAKLINAIRVNGIPLGDMAADGTRGPGGSIPNPDTSELPDLDEPSASGKRRGFFNRSIGEGLSAIGGVSRAGFKLAWKAYSKVGSAAWGLTKLGSRALVGKNVVSPFADVYRKDAMMAGKPLITKKQLKRGLVFNDGKEVYDVAEIDRPVMDPKTGDVLIDEEDIEAGLVDVFGRDISKRKRYTSAIGMAGNLAGGLMRGGFGLGRAIFSKSNPMWGLYGSMLKGLGSAAGGLLNFGAKGLGATIGAGASLGKGALGLINPLFGMYGNLFNFGLNTAKGVLGGAGRMLGRAFGLGGSGDGLNRETLEDVVGKRLDDIYKLLDDRIKDQTIDHDVTGDGIREGSYEDYMRRVSERREKAKAARETAGGGGLFASLFGSHGKKEPTPEEGDDSWGPGVSEGILGTLGLTALGRKVKGLAGKAWRGGINAGKSAGSGLGKLGKMLVKTKAGKIMTLAAAVTGGYALMGSNDAHAAITPSDDHDSLPSPDTYTPTVPETDVIAPSPAVDIPQPGQPANDNAVSYDAIPSPESDYNNTIGTGPSIASKYVATEVADSAGEAAVLSGAQTAGIVAASALAGKARDAIAPHATQAVAKVSPRMAARAAEKAAAKAAGETAAKAAGKVAAKTALGSIAKKIPVVGILFGLGFGALRALEGDWTGAGAEVLSGLVSTVPGVGTAASIAIDGWLGYRDFNRASPAMNFLRARMDAYGVPNPDLYDYIESMEKRVYDTMIGRKDKLTEREFEIVTARLGFDARDTKAVQYVTAWFTNRFLRLFTAYNQILATDYQLSFSDKDKITKEQYQSLSEKWPRVTAGIVGSTKHLVIDAVKFKEAAAKGDLPPMTKEGAYTTSPDRPEYDPVGASNVTDVAKEVASAAPSPEASAVLANPEDIIRKYEQSEQMRNSGINSNANAMQQINTMYPQANADQHAAQMLSAVSGGQFGTGMAIPSPTGTPSMLDVKAASVPVEVGGKIGGLSAKYESGPKGSAAIGWDSTGGTSYGKYQIAAKVGTFKEFINWLANKGPDALAIAQALASAGPGETGSTRGAVPDLWRKLASDGLIQHWEHLFIKERHYDPQFKKMPPEIQDQISKSPTLQDVLWSTAVQHRNTSPKIFSQTYRPNQSVEDWIKAIYANRSGRFGSSKPSVQQSVRNRFKDEASRALAMYKVEKEMQAQEQTKASDTANDNPQGAVAADASGGDISAFGGSGPTGAIEQGGGASSSASTTTTATDSGMQASIPTTPATVAPVTQDASIAIPQAPVMQAPAVQQSAQIPAPEVIPVQAPAAAPVPQVPPFDPTVIVDALSKGSEAPVTELRQVNHTLTEIKALFTNAFGEKGVFSQMAENQKVASSSSAPTKPQTSQAQRSQGRGSSTGFSVNRPRAQSYNNG